MSEARSQSPGSGVGPRAAVAQARRPELTAAPAGAADGVRLPGAFRLLLALTFGLALLVFVLAVVPRRVLPASALEAVDGRRELLAVTGLFVVCLGLVTGLIAVLAAS